MQANQPGIAPPAPPPDDPSGLPALTETLDQLLSSRTFSRSTQLKRLLVYFRDAAAIADPGAWSETAIGAQAFGRKDFNPRLDTIVRVEMRRLRQKLDEYYASEGATLPLRLRFEKNTYRPTVAPNSPPPVEISLAPAPDSPDRFWTGIAAGAGITAFAALLVGLFLMWGTSTRDRAPREILENQLWSGFRSSNVVLAVGTPLFFRSTEGFERNFHENLSDDLENAEQYLSQKPAYPVWNLWAPFDDVAGAVVLDRFLRTLNSTVTIASARQISIGNLEGKRTIIMGQPRQAPLLADLLADQNFRPPKHVPGKHFAGFLNASPNPGEPPDFPGGGAHALIRQTDESDPDYALITSIRLPNGGEVLNFFGDRAQTAAFVARKLTEPAFLSELSARLFEHARSGHRSAQAVFRVDYTRGAPTGLVYVTHRVKFADTK